jgi:hypothetical protein
MKKNKLTKWPNSRRHSACLTTNWHRLAADKYAWDAAALQKPNSVVVRAYKHPLIKLPLPPSSPPGSQSTIAQTPQWPMAAAAAAAVITAHTAMIRRATTGGTLSPQLVASVPRKSRAPSHPAKSMASQMANTERSSGGDFRPRTARVTRDSQAKVERCNGRRPELARARQLGQKTTVLADG